MKRAFTLVELLVSMTVLSILLLVCASVLDHSRRTWSQARARVDQFREARIAFDIITRNLAQAGLNTSGDYHYTETGTNEGPEDNAVPPSAYVRHSELQFQSGTAYQMIGPSASPASYPGHAVFFQAPLGLSVGHPGLLPSAPRAPSPRSRATPSTPSRWTGSARTSALRPAWSRRTSSCS